MRKALLPALLFISILAVNANAQNFNLLKDINTSRDANPRNYINNLYIGFTTTSFFVNTLATPKYATLNGVTYFAADDGIHGTELWRSDKTATGTYIVKDITPGNASSQIQSITAAGNKLYFVVGIIVYESDGTAEGTYAVPGISYTSDQTTCLTAVGNTLYFFTNVSRLWKTDGTLNGTSLVIDFRQVYNYARDFLGQLTDVNGTAYFTTGEDNINGPELWKSDGTQQGTVLVKDIYPGTIGSRPCNLTVVNKKLYFSADDGTGIHLWTSDGTEAGTHAVANQSGAVLNQNINSTDIDVTPFAVAQNIIYFKAGIPTKGFELYKYNTANASANVTLVKDIIPGAAGADPANITAVNDAVFFSATGANGEQQLWKTDGSGTGTILLKSVSTSIANVFSDFVAADGK
ncbi:MAG TPA: ELWxxDGT repeat protein, partial [Parafilimonas sp.]|nr:ELWxxDGT repeat protein [Parafilimonas sp.]